ncbi:hypothetical protein CSB92_2856 [Pseudomonas aeruginosa]|nr:hypothetical protein CSC30_4080 [Pseudomonas aeruginosa]AWF67140.1 hypothetical protein CSC27_6646 [Pseudomonas aeruginosa]PRW11828.1 hypothetical protein CSB92_2856 [Pseudomonas aeruginosa]
MSPGTNVVAYGAGRIHGSQKGSQAIGAIAVLACSDLEGLFLDGLVGGGLKRLK